MPAVIEAEDLFAWTPFSFPFNATGHPACSLPVGFDSDGDCASNTAGGPCSDDDNCTGVETCD